MYKLMHQDIMKWLLYKIMPILVVCNTLLVKSDQQFPRDSTEDTRLVVIGRTIAYVRTDHGS